MNSDKNYRKNLKILYEKLREVQRSTWIYCIVMVVLVLDLLWIRVDGCNPPWYSEGYQTVGKTFISIMIIEFGGIIWLLNHFSRNAYKPTEDVDTSGDIFAPGTQFFVDRSDSLDREIHYIRSGISILAGIFSGVVVLLWDFDRVLTDAENNAIFLLSILVFFCVISILLSFGSNKVTKQGANLENHLMPGEYSEDLYKELVKGVLVIKSNRLNKMRGTMVAGLSVFLLLGSVFLSEPFLSPINSSVSIFPFESGAISVMFLLLCILGVTAIANEMDLLGVHVLDDSKNNHT